MAPYRNSAIGSPSQPPRSRELGGETRQWPKKRCKNRRQAKRGPLRLNLPAGDAKSNTPTTAVFSLPEADPAAGIREEARGRHSCTTRRPRTCLWTGWASENRSQHSSSSNACATASSISTSLPLPVTLIAPLEVRSYQAACSETRPYPTDLYPRVLTSFGGCQKFPLKTHEDHVPQTALTECLQPPPPGNEWMAEREGAMRWHHCPDFQPLTANPPAVHLNR